MKKLVFILATLLFSNAMAYDVITIPFHLISGRSDRMFQVTSWNAKEVSDADSPWAIVGVILSPFFLLNEESGMLEASTDQLKEQGFTDKELQAVQTELNNFSEENSGKKYSSKTEVEKALRSSLKSDASLEVIGLE